MNKFFLVNNYFPPKYYRNELINSPKKAPYKIEPKGLDVMGQVPDLQPISL